MTEFTIICAIAIMLILLLFIMIGIACYKNRKISILFFTLSFLILIVCAGGNHIFKPEEIVYTENECNVDEMRRKLNDNNEDIYNQKNGSMFLTKNKYKENSLVYFYIVKKWNGKEEVVFDRWIYITKDYQEDLFPLDF